MFLLTLSLNLNGQLLNNTNTLDNLCTLEPKDKDTEDLCNLFKKNKLTNDSTSILIVRKADSLGQKYLGEAEYIKAEQLFTYSSENYRHFNLKQELCNSLIHLGRTHYRQGNIFESFKSLNEGLLLSQELNYTEEEGLAHLYLSWNYWRIRQCDEALVQLENMKEMMDTGTLSHKQLGNYYNARGNFENCIGNSEFAQIMADSTISFSKRNNEKRLESVAMSNKVNYLPVDSHFDEKYRLVNMAIEINRAQNDKEQLGSNLGLLANVYIQDSKYLEALEAALASLKICKEINDKPRTLHAINNCRKAYVGLGDFSNAYYYERDARVLRDEIFGLRHIDKIFDLQKAKDKAEQEQKLMQIASEKELEQLKISQERKLYFIGFGAMILVLIGGIYSWFTYKKNKEKETLLVKEVLENEMRELELQSLRAMMNPHFIFNSLNSIKGFIIRNEQNVAADYLNKFSHLIRLILANSQKSEISLTEELKALEMYIQLEGLRLEGKFNYEIKVDETIDTDRIKVAPMIIQPFVENSIWHGLMSKEGEKKLTIKIQQQNSRIHIVVNDNGIGRKASQQKRQNIGFKKKSYGMKITENRIKYAQQENTIQVQDLISPENDPMGTEVIIQLNPKSNE